MLVCAARCNLKWPRFVGLFVGEVAGSHLSLNHGSAAHRISTWEGFHGPSRRQHAHGLGKYGSTVPRSHQKAQDFFSTSLERAQGHFASTARGLAGRMECWAGFRAIQAKGILSVQQLTTEQGQGSSFHCFQAFGRKTEPPEKERWTKGPGAEPRARTWAWVIGAVGTKGHVR
jgi:hypothetical protein